MTTSTAAKEETAPILDTTKEVKSLEDFQLEPTLEELESERLNARAEQVRVTDLRTLTVECFLLTFNVFLSFKMRLHSFVIN